MVRQGERTEGKLQVLNKARELKEYSLQILKNDKIFPKSTRWLYAYPIANEVRTVCNQIRQANSVYVKTNADFDYRRNQQTEAHAHLCALFGLVEDAYLAKYISDRQVEYWTQLMVNTNTCLVAWMERDLEHFKKK